MIRAISFDADQTLWDFRGVMQRALARTADDITRRYPQLAVSADELQAVRNEVVVGFRGSPHSLEEVREESFRVVLERGGVAAAEAARVATELAGRYLDMRFQEIEMYDDVQPTLELLRGRYRLALISNGNTDPDRCGLAGVFDAVVLGPDHGIEKPDPRAFELAAAQLQIETTEMVHVGDGGDDVAGANHVGAVSVLIDRGEVEVEREVRERAGFAIRSLTELTSVLASVGRIDGRPRPNDP